MTKRTKRRMLKRPLAAVLVMALLLSLFLITTNADETYNYNYDNGVAESYGNGDDLLYGDGDDLLYDNEDDDSSYGDDDPYYNGDDEDKDEDEFEEDEDTNEGGFVGINPTAGILPPAGNQMTLHYYGLGFVYANPAIWPANQFGLLDNILFATSTTNSLTWNIPAAPHGWRLTRAVGEFGFNAPPPGLGDNVFFSIGLDRDDPSNNVFVSAGGDTITLTEDTVTIEVRMPLLTPGDFNITNIWQPQPGFDFFFEPIPPEIKKSAVVVAPATATEPVVVGDIIEYTITVTNNAYHPIAIAGGPGVGGQPINMQTFSNFRVEDILPPGLMLVPEPGSGSPATIVVECNYLEQGLGSSVVVYDDSASTNTIVDITLNLPPAVDDGNDIIDGVVTITFWAQVTDAALAAANGREIINTARLHDSYRGGYTYDTAEVSVASTLWGTVTCELTGRPVEDVTVRLYEWCEDADDYVYSRSEVTDQHGFFDFGNIPAGRTQLRMDYDTRPADYTVTHGNNVSDRNWTALPGADYDRHFRVQPHPEIEKTVNPTSTTPGSLVTYTITIDTGGMNTTKFADVVMVDPLHALLDLSTVNITSVTGITNAATAVYFCTTDDAIKAYGMQLTSDAVTEVVITFTANVLGTATVGATIPNIADLSINRTFTQTRDTTFDRNTTPDQTNNWPFTPTPPNTSTPLGNDNATVTVTGGGGTGTGTTSTAPTLTGTVTCEDTGRPIPGATVRLYRQNAQGNWVFTGQEVQTNTSGFFDFGQVPVGELEVRVSGIPAGYANRTGLIRRVTTAPNGAFEAHFRVGIPSPRITKTASYAGNQLQRGGTVTYTITIDTDGMMGIDFRNVVVRDPLPAGLTAPFNIVSIVGATAQNQLFENNVLIVSGMELATSTATPHGYVTQVVITVTATVAANAPAGVIRNTAFLDYYEEGTRRTRSSHADVTVVAPPPPGSGGGGWVGGSVGGGGGSWTGDSGSYYEGGGRGTGRSVTGGQGTDWTANNQDDDVLFAVWPGNTDTESSTSSGNMNPPTGGFANRIARAVLGEDASSGSVSGFWIVFTVLSGLMAAALLRLRLKEMRKPRRNNR